MKTNCKTPDKCRITQGAAATTCTYYPPCYDGHGNNLNPDMNVTSYSSHCSVCDRTWDVEVQNGEMTIVEKPMISADNSVKTHANRI